MSGPGSVVGIATGYRLDGPGIESRWGARFSAPVQTGPGAHPASCTMGTGSFPGVKSGRGVTLTPHPLLALWSWKGRAIPLLPLWAVRPVQSLSACTRVTFTFIQDEVVNPQTPRKCTVGNRNFAFKLREVFRDCNSGVKWDLPVYSVCTKQTKAVKNVPCYSIVIFWYFLSWLWNRNGYLKNVGGTWPSSGAGLR